jgi:hypothetical protein
VDGHALLITPFRFDPVPERFFMPTTGKAVWHEFQVDELCHDDPGKRLEPTQARPVLLPAYSSEVIWPAGLKFRSTPPDMIA